jgi:predicted transcriptional regulator
LATRSKKQGARILFASEQFLWKTLTPKRWAFLKLMAGQRSMAIREIARRAERVVRAVHSDIQSCFDCRGISNKGNDQKQVDGHELSSDNVRQQPPFRRGVFGGIPRNRNSRNLELLIFPR